MHQTGRKQQIEGWTQLPLFCSNDLGHNMASQRRTSLNRHREPLGGFLESLSRPYSVVLPLFLCAMGTMRAQMMLRPAEAGELVHPMPSDVVVLESDETRKDIPCTIAPQKPELGFDLRFHGGYQVTVPLRELSGE